MSFGMGQQERTGGSGTAVGLDIGYTNIRGVLMDGEGRIFRHARELTDSTRSPQSILAQAAGMIRQLSDSEKVVGVGVGIAGQCESGSGIVHCGPNLWWDDEPFGGRLSEEVNLPVALRNDVQMATLGEWRHGAGKGCDNMACIFVGTGVGGGAVIGGRLLNGASGCGGHFGHVSVSLEGPRCACGRVGCVEAYAGGLGVANRAREIVRSDTISGLYLLQMVEDVVERITAREVSRAAQEGDPLSLKIREDMIAALVSGTASVVNSFDPELVVLGGSVLMGFPGMFEEVREGVHMEVIPPIRPRLRIAPAQLGDVAGAVGAASLVLRPE